MMTRKQFLHSAIELGAVAFGLRVLSACGDGSKSPPDAAPAASCLQNGTGTTIGSNHGHALVVSKADISAAADKTYHIMGTATHDHTVTLTAAQFAQLAANNAIMTTSSTDASHSHSIMVACV
jgi:hypothetical protein